MADNLGIAALYSFRFGALNQSDGTGIGFNCVPVFLGFEQCVGEPRKG